MGEGLLLLDGLLGTGDPTAEPASPLSALWGVGRPQVNRFTTDRSILGWYLGPQFMVLSVVGGGCFSRRTSVDTVLSIADLGGGLALPLPPHFEKHQVLYCVHKVLKNYFYVLVSSVAQPCPALCDPMNRSMPGLPFHHQLPEFTQTHVH